MTSSKTSPMQDSDMSNSYNNNIVQQQQQPPRIAVDSNSGPSTLLSKLSNSPCPDSCFTFSEADVALESNQIINSGSSVASFDKRHFDFASFKTENDNEQSLDYDLEFLQVVLVPNSGGSMSTQNSSQSGFSPMVSCSVESCGNCLDGLATLRIQPDEHGRFGFHVKGGTDRDEIVTVSRITTNSPADLCSPKLNVGDHVLFINGRDISSHTHEQVVQFIRSAAEKHSRELVLVVRQSTDGGGAGGRSSGSTGQSTDSCCSYRLMEPHSLNKSQHPSPSSSSKDRASPSLWSSDFIPDPPTQPRFGATGDPLHDSILALQESLENGQALEQFEQLYRHKRGLTTVTADHPLNASKNRYKDILPYDQTRVVLHSGTTEGGGDTTDNYINANYINMEIANTGTVNRYIASQGPLQSTCEQFWRMIWEQQVSLIVMLTAITESGREKCYQYWPDLSTTQTFGSLTVTCVSVSRREATTIHLPPSDGSTLTTTSSSSCLSSSPLCREQELYRSLLDSDDSGYTEREFLVQHNSDKVSDCRRIVQLQYHSWLDYAPPLDNEEFCNFVQRVRDLRGDCVNPLLVHCSAGIGRTGVLITMETAFCLMEKGEPIVPLKLVQQMRDQRAMLVQTESQYKFVCESILRVFKEHIRVKKQETIENVVNQ